MQYINGACTRKQQSILGILLQITAWSKDNTHSLIFYYNHQLNVVSVTNKRKLNPDKTELLLIGNERQRNKYLSMFSIELSGVKTNPAKSARNLGVIFDKTFTIHSHISAVCSSCFHHMRDLRRIWRDLDLDSAKVFVAGLGSSRLDYCHSLLYAIAVAAPVYLQSVLAASLPSRSLRSSKGSSLSVPRVHTNTGAMAFHSCAPSTSSCCLSVQPFQLLPLRNSCRHISLTWLSPTDTSTPNGLLMLRSFSPDFAIEHRFGCRATEPGLAADIDAMEIWLSSST